MSAEKLPAGGYTGEIPDFPFDDGTAREIEVWKEAWRTPQAARWAVEPWRRRTIAMWVRWSVRMEDADAPAAIGATATRLADQIGLTPAGLRENGWEIAPDEVAEKRVERSSSSAPAEQSTGAVPQRRLRSVVNGDG